MRLFIISLTAIFLLVGCQSNDKIVTNSINGGNGEFEFLKGSEQYEFTADQFTENGYVVYKFNEEVTNLDKAKVFFEKVEAGESAKLGVIAYTIEGDPIIREITYDKNKLSFVSDSTADAYAGSGKGRVTIPCDGAEVVSEGDILSYKLTGCEYESDVIGENILFNVSNE